MKKLLIVLLGIASISSYSQPVYQMSNMVVYDCEGILTDSDAGVPSGNYSHNESYIFTIQAPIVTPIIFSFSEFCTESSYDTLMIYDWKRSCKLKEKTNPFRNMLSPLDHLPDTNYWHYAMQLNIYRHILETKYGKTIVGMYLVGIHPDLTGFQQEKVPFLKVETDAVFAHRKSQLQS